MSIVKYSTMLGMVAGSTLLFTLYQEYKRFTRKYSNKILVFSDRCSICGKPMNKRMTSSKQCCRQNLTAMLKYLDSAQVSLDICMYVITCDQLTNAILRAYNRGVEVRVITDSEMAFASNSGIEKFFRQGIPIKWKKSTTLMHHKFCIIDGPVRQKLLYRWKSLTGVLMTGSLNWTTQGWGGNWEHLLIVTNPQILAGFQQCFDNLWVNFEKFALPPKPSDFITIGENDREKYDN